jgi:hypothetical protein
MAEKPSKKQAHDLKRAASRIRSEFRLAHRAGRDAVQHAIKAGEALIACKAKLPHGAWLGWLKKNCPAISERTAQAYMQVAQDGPKLLAAKSATTADLTLRKAIEITAQENHGEPRAVRAEVSHEHAPEPRTVKATPSLPATDDTEEEVEPEQDYESQLAEAIVGLERLVRLACETLSGEQCAKMAGHIQRIALLLTEADADRNGDHPESGSRV